MAEHFELHDLKLSACLFRDFLSRKADEMRALAMAGEFPHREALLRIADDLAHTAAPTREDVQNE